MSIGKIRNIGGNSGGAELVIVDNTKTNSEYAEFYTHLANAENAVNKFTDGTGWQIGLRNTWGAGTDIFSITKAIDVSNYKTLTFVKFGMNTTMYLGISDNTTSADFVTYVNMPSYDDPAKTYSLDISDIKGNKYIKIVVITVKDKSSGSAIISDLRFTRKPTS